MSIAQLLQPYVDRGTLAGAVTLVATRDGVSSREAVGFSDLAARTPMRGDALFWIASISKPITAAALMMLVDEGRVDPEQPVARYLPEFEGQQLIAESGEERTVLVKPPRAITVRDVLAHTSGLPFMTRAEQGKIDRLTLAEAAISYAMSPLSFAPGTKWSYANAGTNTAGRIIEVVGGKPYDEFLRERLLAPLGMVDTTFVPTRAQLARLAKSYKPSAGGGLEELPITQCIYPLDAPTRRPSPAGGLFSTAADLARFGRMLLRGGELDGRRYLSEAAVARMSAKQTGDLENAYGFACDADKGDGVFGHGGAYATDLRIDRRRGLVLVYLVQHAGYGNPDGNEILPAFRAAAAQQAAAGR
jgi:CubicO group peptidase (beta-lactamase class C family)